MKDGHITRIEEYLDSARRADIRKAREALSGEALSGEALSG